MSRPKYNIPVPSTLTPLTANSVGLRMNQIVGLLLQLNQRGTPSFPDLASIQTKSNWDTLIADTGAPDLVVFTPPFGNTKIAESKIFESAADSNDTYLGLPEYYGEGITMVTADFHNIDSDALSSVDSLLPFSQLNGAGIPCLTAYLINNDGQIFCNPDFSGIPIVNITRRVRGTDGLNKPDVIGLKWYHPPYTLDNLIPVVPTFDPRLYLANF